MVITAERIVVLFKEFLPKLVYPVRDEPLQYTLPTYANFPTK